MDSTGKMFPKENQMPATFIDLSAVGNPLGPNLASIRLIGHGFQLWVDKDLDIFKNIEPFPRLFIVQGFV